MPEAINVCVHDAGNDCKYYVFKIEVFVQYKFKFFWSSNFLLAGGRLIGRWFI